MNHIHAGHMVVATDSHAGEEGHLVVDSLEGDSLEAGTLGAAEEGSRPVDPNVLAHHDHCYRANHHVTLLRV